MLFIFVFYVRIRYGFNGDGSKYPFDSGVGHTDDLIYLLPTSTELNKLNGADTRIMEIMIDLWTSFATTGIPKITTNPFFQWIPMLSMNHFDVFHIMYIEYSNFDFFLSNLTCMCVCVGSREDSHGPFLHIDKYFHFERNFTNQYRTNEAGKRHWRNLHIPLPWL